MEVEEKKNQEAKNAFYQQRRFWFYIAFFFAVIILFISYLAFQYAVNKHDEPQEGFNTSSTESVVSSKKDYNLGCLTGTGLKEGESCPPLYAVMIENHFDARPLSSVSLADMVFEFPVEGGITRFMAIFNSSSTASKIGPIRSARPYYVEYARSLDAVYAHVGGSPEALNRISGLYKFKNLDEMANENSFWRDSNRYPPHNAYTSIKKINQVYEFKKWQHGQQPDFWNFIDEDSTSSTSSTDTSSTTSNFSAQKVTILYGGSYNVSWVYDLQTKEYIRYQSKRIQKDKDGSIVKAKNLIIIYTDQKVLDKKGRLRITVNGQGKAIIVSNGQQQIASWHKKTGEFISFSDADGKEISFYPGQTWLSFITLKNQKVLFEK